MSRRVRDEFHSAVEAARMGHIFASNLTAYNRWRQAVSQPLSAHNDDRKIEGQIMRLAAEFPGSVIRGTI